MSCGPGTYGATSRYAMWNVTPGDDDRVKQILADVARQVEQTSTTTTRKQPAAVGPHGSSTLCPPPKCSNFLGQAVGHDPADHISTEQCLLGCVFFIAADYLQSFAPSEIESWTSAIKKLGGQVDKEYSSQITHVLCSTQFLDAARAALIDIRRLVTAYWLADAIKSKRMDPPTRATHLPCPFMPPAYPMSNLLVAVTGFKGVDRMDVRLLLAAIGAIFTTHLTPRHTILIAAKASGAKYDSAIRWNIPVVNSSWLKDVYFGNLTALKLPVASYYLVKPSQAEEDSSEGGLFRLQPSDLPNITHLFAPWKHYLKVPRDALKRRFGDLHLLDRTESPKENSDVQGNQLSSSEKPRVIITGFSTKAAYDLAHKVRMLGGEVLDSVGDDCTHLVAPSVIFTIKFLAAFSHTRFIVAPEWIEASCVANKFLPESGFQLRDPVSERIYGCNLLLAQEKSSHGQLFKGMGFFISPSIQPRPSLIRTLVTFNDGVVLEQPPPADTLVPLSCSKSQADEARPGSSSASDKEQQPPGGARRPSNVVIANPQDTPAFRDLYPPHVPIHSVEFILTACLRQELNFSDFVIKR